MKRLAASLACGVLACTSALAGSGTATLTARTTVNTNCTISTVAIAFGSYNPIGTNKTSDLNASGSIVIACVKGTAPTIGLGLGSNASGTTRRMFDATANDYLTYELYQPPSNAAGTACSYPGSTVWGTSGANLLSATSAPTKAARTYNVCGTVAKAQNPSIGASYADTVVATVNF